MVAELSFSSMSNRFPFYKFNSDALLGGCVLSIVFTWPNPLLVLLTDTEFQFVLFTISFSEKFDIHPMDYAFVSLYNSPCFSEKC
jgi:hypothetical protein